MRHCIVCRLATSRGCAKLSQHFAARPRHCAYLTWEIQTLDRPAVIVRRDGVFGARLLQVPTIVETALHPKKSE